MSAMRVQPAGTPAQAGAAAQASTMPAATAMAAVARIDSDETEVRAAEVREVREDRREVGRRGHAEPLRERRRVLVDADAGDHLAAREVVRRVEVLVRESADRSAAVRVQLASVDRAAERELHATPGMVRTGAVRLQRA